MASVVAQPMPAHPTGFLLHQSHHHPESVPVPVPQQQPAPPKPAPADPYYGHEETARICSRLIRHVFNCPPETVAPPHIPNTKPTEQTVPLPKFVAYAFHRTRLPPSVAFHALFLLSRLKSRYPAASCAYGHRLFLTSYMLSSKVICDDTYSNKSWAIVGQGFYDLRDVNLMEREMIHYLSWDLTISGKELSDFTDRTRFSYKRGVPKTPYQVVLDTSREKDSFGKGSIEPEQKKLPGPVPLESTASPSDPVPPYTAYPDEVISPYSDSSSASSSRESSPPSPCLKTPPDESSSAPGSPDGKPVPIEYTLNPADLKHGITAIREEREHGSWGWAARTAW